MDKFTLEEIKIAIINTIDRADPLKDETYADMVIDYLTRPKHSFREGEVAATVAQDPELGTEYVQWGDGKWKIPLRPLTLSEMPKAVEDLREWVRNGTTTSIQALAAFDSEISHE